MKFINKGEPIKFRIGDIHGYPYWKTAYTGDVIDLPKEYGRALGLTELKTTEGKIANKVVETKQISVPEKIEEVYTPDDLFFKELIKIKGIGKKTAEDIVTWGTKEKLIEAIKLEKNLPFRDDIDIKLRKKYGRSSN